MKVDSNVQFSLRRFICCVTLLAMVIVCFQQAFVFEEIAETTQTGHIRISPVAILLQWFGVSVFVGSLAVIPFGRKGLCIGILVAFLVVPLAIVLLLWIQGVLTRGF